MERDAPKQEESGLHPCHSDLLCDAVRLPHGTIASLLLQSIGDAIGNADHRRSIPHAGEVHDATRHSHEVHGATRHVHEIPFPIPGVGNYGGNCDPSRSPCGTLPPPGTSCIGPASRPNLNLGRSHGTSYPGHMLCGTIRGL